MITGTLHAMCVKSAGDHGSWGRAVQHVAIECAISIASGKVVAVQRVLLLTRRDGFR